MMAVNVRGTWLGLRQAIPEIARRGGGSIVLTASTAGFRAGAPGRARVWVLRDGAATAIPVVTGDEDGDRVAVQSPEQRMQDRVLVGAASA